MLFSPDLELFLSLSRRQETHYSRENGAAFQRSQDNEARFSWKRYRDSDYGSVQHTQRSKDVLIGP